MEKKLKELINQRKVLSFEDIKKIFNLDKEKLIQFIDELEKEGYVIKGKIFGSENSYVYLPIDINDEYLDKIRIIELRGHVHLVAIWRIKNEWKIANMYLGELNEILKNNFNKAILTLNERNKVVFETYK
jgi:hypothetical protein